MHFRNLLLEPVRSLLSRAYVPYGKEPQAAVALLSDGMMVPGVRVENASLSLTVPASATALAACAAFGRSDVVALRVFPDPMRTERAFVETASFARLAHAAPGLFVESANSMPEPSGFLSPARVPDGSVDRLLEEAHALLERAHAPSSGFSVACVIRGRNRVLFGGVNVEHPDWSRTLCAERAALATALAYGCESVIDVVVVSSGAAPIAPCGACRQFFLELAPDAKLWMERGATSREGIAVRELLPDAFSHANLLDGGLSGGSSDRADDRTSDPPPRCC